MNLQVGSWCFIYDLDGFNSVIGHIYQVGDIRVSSGLNWYEATINTWFSGSQLPFNCLKQLNKNLINLL